MSRHLELVDAVNDAKTHSERALAEARLQGYREGASINGISLMEADLYSMEKHGKNAPMCCGVLLDWQPDGDSNNV